MLTAGPLYKVIIVSELRGLIPNGHKMSIDRLLGRTIRHLNFMQSLTEHAAALKQINTTTKNVEVVIKKSGSSNGGVTWALPPPSVVSLVRKVGAEFIGTLILMFAGTATAIVNQKTDGSKTLLGLAASSGLAVMIVILSTGHIFGAHLNPSLTIAFALSVIFHGNMFPCT